MSLSDTLFLLKEKKVSVVMGEEDDHMGYLINSDQNGIMLKEHTEGEGDCVVYIPFSKIVYIQYIVDDAKRIVQQDDGLMVEDSEDMLLQKETKLIEAEVKELAVDYDGSALVITDENDDTVMDGDDEVLTVYDEKYFEQAKSIARILEWKKIIRDYK
jgi:hypothetical protein